MFILSFMYLYSMMMAHKTMLLLLFDLTHTFLLLFYHLRSCRDRQGVPVLCGSAIHGVIHYYYGVTVSFSSFDELQTYFITKASALDSHLCS